MPSFDKHKVINIYKDLKAFFSLQAGLTRGEIPDHRSTNKLSEPTAKKIYDKDRQIAALRKKLAESGDRRLIDAKNLTWIFGTARVGSTWLGAMLEELKDHFVWHEPIVGRLFGEFYYGGAEHRRGKHFIMGDRYKELWLESIRELVLSGATARFPKAQRQGTLVIKEPNGSIGAPLLMSALPESRMIFLVRDPRDVAASALDASRKGGWLSEGRGAKVQVRTARTEENPDGVVRGIANKYVRYVGNTLQAYEAHTGPKVLVRYETLREDTLSEMKRVHEVLDIQVDDRELARVIEDHSWESIPKEKKGEGKFYRKASPGGWREDLTQAQVKIVEQTTKSLLDEFYPDSRTTG